MLLLIICKKGRDDFIADLTVVQIKQLGQFIQVIFSGIW